MLYYDITEMFLKKLMLLRQVYQKSAIFVTIGVF